jgi:GH15 family glucan-1,4-alpha-glucosidase
MLLRVLRASNFAVWMWHLEAGCSVRLEDYALIGDCETAALVGRNGSIDWLCWPDFSSPACFAALLGTKENGRWRIAPKERPRNITRRYRDHTLILETTFETASGRVVLTDFMPIRARHSDVVRIVRCLHGRVTLEMELCVRFDYGRTIPWIGPRNRNEWAAAAGGGVVYLRTHEQLRNTNGVALAEFTLKAGEQRSFVLTYVTPADPAPRRVNTQVAMRETEAFWLEWTGRSKYSGDWKEAVERSLITLKALTYRPTGGIVAAPTTSLPEYIGGDRNWDYRYCWLRDAAFTMESLLSVGYHEEANAWQQWLLQSVGGDVRQMQIMYGMHGERHLPEYELPWLRGYSNSGPVCIGNAASQQSQLDVYGELADAIATLTRSNLHLDPRTYLLWTQLTDYVTKICSHPSSGIWERREMRRQFTFSKVMTWVALDHGLKAAERGEMDGSAKRWRRLRNDLHREICEHGFSKPLESFVQSYRSRTLDASSLLIPLFGFLPFDDKRVRTTLRAIEKELVRNGFVYRVKARTAKDQEAAFLPSSFWYVQNLVMTGRRSEGKRYYEKLLQLRNDVGLLAEEYDPQARRLLGNFPQALSHIALINAARSLDTGI